jgi:hypothetical protein
VRGNLTSKIAIAAVVAVLSVGVVGVGAASASVTFSVTPNTGLTDPQQVHVHMEGINAITLATIELSECGNGYGDGSALPSFNVTTDCQMIDRIDVSNSPTLDVDEPVVQTGIGTGNRTCISGGNFACALRVTHMVNQMGATPAPAPISFASPPGDTTPIATTTTASVRGGSAVVGGPVNVQVVVSTANTQFKPEGDVSVDIDGDIGVASGTLGSDGTVVVTAPAYPHGTRSIVAHYSGNPSFSGSDSSASPFSVINADNVSIGDVSVVEGNTGSRKIYFPVVLSKAIPKTSVTIGWTFQAGDTKASDVSTAASGKIVFLPGSTTATASYVHPLVLGDTSPEPDEHFYIDLSLLGTAKSRDFEIRRGRGTGTIIDDDTNPSGPSVSVGDASIQEGDGGGNHYIKLPLTFSDAALVPVYVTVQVSSTDALHLAKSKGGDWAGLINRTIKFLPGQLQKNVGILEYPDLKDEPDLHVRAQITAVTAGTGILIGRAAAVGTILSDE